MNDYLILTRNNYPFKTLASHSTRLTCCMNCTVQAICLQIQTHNLTYRTDDFIHLAFAELSTREYYSPELNHSTEQFPTPKQLVIRTTIVKLQFGCWWLPTQPLRILQFGYVLSSMPPFGLLQFGLRPFSAARLLQFGPNSLHDQAKDFTSDLGLAQPGMHVYLQQIYK